MPDYEIDLGETVRLSLTVDDGNTGVFPKATIYNGSVVPVAAVNLTHVALGMYRGDFTPSLAKNFDVVFRVFSDPARTVETDYLRRSELIKVNLPPDEPRLGVVFDSTADQLLVNVHVLRKGVRINASLLSSATVTVFDDDNNAVLGPMTDSAPDGEGVFRFSLPSPGLVADRLYIVKISVVLTTHTITGQKGFKAVP